MSFANIVSQSMAYLLIPLTLSCQEQFFTLVMSRKIICVCVCTHTHINIYLFILAASVLSCGPGPMRWVENLPGFEVLGFPSEEPVLPWWQSPESNPS